MNTHSNPYRNCEASTRKQERRREKWTNLSQHSKFVCRFVFGLLFDMFALTSCLLHKRTSDATNTRWKTLFDLPTNEQRIECGLRKSYTKTHKFIQCTAQTETQWYFEVNLSFEFSINISKSCNTNWKICRLIYTSSNQKTQTTESERKLCIANAMPFVNERSSTGFCFNILNVSSWQNGKYSWKVDSQKLCNTQSLAKYLQSNALVVLLWEIIILTNINIYIFDWFTGQATKWIDFLFFFPKRILKSKTTLHCFHLVSRALGHSQNSTAQFQKSVINFSSSIHVFSVWFFLRKNHQFLPVDVMLLLSSVFYFISSVHLECAISWGNTYQMISFRKLFFFTLNSFCILYLKI